jgi:hypothetical protein
MEGKMIAYCGIDCCQCPAYIATKNDDDNIRRETVEKWNTPEYPIKIEDLNCDGCKAASGVYFRWCTKCEIRTCGMDREVETCAHCDDYTCGKLEKMFEMVGEGARKVLDDIRNSL